MTCVAKHSLYATCTYYCVGCVVLRVLALVLVAVPVGCLTAPVVLCMAWVVKLHVAGSALINVLAYSLILLMLIAVPPYCTMHDFYVHH